MNSFEELISIIKRLRGENGCAWDREQTFESLIPCFLEESYELVEAISNKDYENIKEELGDVLLHVVFFSELARDEKQFNNLKCHCKPLDALQTPGRLESTSQHAVDNFRT